jgi:hypothetical protein
MGIANGSLVSGGPPATLLIFDFHFISNSVSQTRRFKSATITLKVEAADKQANVMDSSADPEVWKICPSGKFVMNKSTRVRKVAFKPKAGLNAGYGGVGGEAGVEWELDETISEDHHTRITGLKRIQRKPASGKPNTAIWSLQENTHKKDGLPSFLRTCVLLRLTSKAPFRAEIKVESEVDFRTEVKRLVGLEGFDPVDPFTIVQDDHREEDLGPDQLPLGELGSIDLSKLCGVIAASVIGQPEEGEGDGQGEGDSGGD